MIKKELHHFIHEQLSSWRNEKGGILNSSHETLKPGKIYYLGFNPGDGANQPLSLSIDTLLSYKENAFLDEVWLKGYTKGRSPHQNRVRWIFEQLGIDIRDVCASNLIFMKSKTANDIDGNLAKTCWPVHKEILKVIQPKLIIACGNSLRRSSYSFLLSQLDGDEDDKNVLPKAGHGNWSIRGFRACLSGKNIYVAGLPHLSRYNPIGKDELIKWLREKI